MTVVLFDRQIRFLDGLAARMRAEHGAAISRAQLIRALIDSVGDTAGASTGESASDSANSSISSSASLTQSMLAKLGLVRPKG